MSYVTRQTPYVIPHKSHLTRHTSYVTRHTSRHLKRHGTTILLREFASFKHVLDKCSSSSGGGIIILDPQLQQAAFAKFRLEVLAAANALRKRVCQTSRFTHQTSKVRNLTSHVTSHTSKVTLSRPFTMIPMRVQSASASSILQIVKP